MDATRASEFVSKLSENIYDKWESESTDSTDLFWENKNHVQQILEEAVANLPSVPLKAYLLQDLDTFAQLLADRLRTRHENSGPLGEYFVLEENPQTDTLHSENKSKPTLYDEDALKEKGTEAILSQFNTLIQYLPIVQVCSDGSIQELVNYINSMCHCMQHLAKGKKELSDAEKESVRAALVRVWNAFLMPNTIAPKDKATNNHTLIITKFAALHLTLSIESDYHTRKAITLILFADKSNLFESIKSMRWATDVLLQFYTVYIQACNVQKLDHSQKKNLIRLFESALSSDQNMFNMNQKQDNETIAFLYTLVAYHQGLEYVPELAHSNVSTYVDSLANQKLPRQLSKFVKNKKNYERSLKRLVSKRTDTCANILFNSPRILKTSDVLDLLDSYIHSQSTDGFAPSNTRHLFYIDSEGKDTEQFETNKKRKSVIF